MNQDDIVMIQNLLAVILQNENEPRIEAESKLTAAKTADPSKYFCYLVQIMGQCPESGVKSLAAVILRRSLLEKHPSDKTKIMWDLVSAEAKEWIKVESLKTLMAT